MVSDCFKRAVLAFIFVFSVCFSFSGPVYSQEPNQIPLQDFEKLIEPEILNQVRTSNEQFKQYFDLEQKYIDGSEEVKKELVKEWIANARHGADAEKLNAIAALGNAEVEEATGVLISIVSGINETSQARWLALRGLVVIGEPKTVPLMIKLIKDEDPNMQAYAQYGLAMLTKVYFGDDQQKWVEWFKENKKKVVDLSQQAIGKWKAVDLVENPEDFVPGQKKFCAELFLKELELFKDRKLIMESTAGTSNTKTFIWHKKGVIRHQGEKTESKFEIKEIDSKIYMFYQWYPSKKSDGTFSYYVLEKVEKQ